MVRLTCANEYCLYSFQANDDDSEDLPFCEWCLQRKLKARLSLGNERDRALQDLRQPWKGYSYKHMPAAIVDKLRGEKRNAFAPPPPPTISPTQAVAPPAVRLPEPRRKSSLKATIADSPPPPTSIDAHWLTQGNDSREPPANDGVKMDFYLAAQTGQDALPVPAADSSPSTPTAHGLPSLEKQLRTAEANLRQLRGSDPTSVATKMYIKQQIEKLRADIYNSKSLADQVVTMQALVQRAVEATKAADKALQAATEVKALKQKAYDAASAEEEDLRTQHHELESRLHREQDAARLQDASSPIRRISEQLPDTAKDLITTIRVKKNTSLLKDVFFLLGQEHAIAEDFSIPQFTELLTKTRAEHQMQQAAAPRPGAASTLFNRPGLDDKSWRKSKAAGSGSCMDVDPGPAPPAFPAAKCPCGKDAVGGTAFCSPACSQAYVASMPKFHQPAAATGLGSLGQVPPMPTFSLSQTERFTISSPRQMDTARENQPAASPLKSELDLMRAHLWQHVPGWILDATDEHHIEVLYGAHGLPGVDPDDLHVFANELSHLENADLPTKEKYIAESLTAMKARFPAYFEAVILVAAGAPDPQESRDARIASRSQELQDASLFNAAGGLLAAPAIQAILAKPVDEVIELIRFEKDVPPTRDDVAALCGVYLFTRSQNLLDPTLAAAASPDCMEADSSAAAAPTWNSDMLRGTLFGSSPNSGAADGAAPTANGEAGTGPATSPPAAAASGDSLPIPQLQPAQGPGIQSEEESVPLAQEVIDLDPSGPRSSKAHLGKAPFKAPRVGLKEKDRSETDVKAAHALKAQKLSAASAKSSLDALRAADAAPASPKSPFLLFAGQKQAAATAVPASPKPSPRKEPPSSEPCTPTQVIESDDSCFREDAAGGAAT